MRIFISYRRKDSEWQVDRLYDELLSLSGLDPDEIFFDLESIEIGDRFPQTIQSAVSNCEFLFVVAGSLWNPLSGPSGKRLLDNENDWVRKEIQIANDLGKKIIPILIDDTPDSVFANLPEDLQFIADINFHRVSRRNLKQDVFALLDSLGFEPSDKYGKTNQDPLAGLRPEVAFAVSKALEFEQLALEAAKVGQSFAAKKQEILEKSKAKTDGYNFKKAGRLFGSKDVYGLTRAGRFDGPVFIEDVKGDNMGASYVGEYRCGYKNGFGVYYLGSGDRYEGEIANDLPNGVGVYYWKNLNSYAGQEFNGARHGFGVRRVGDGTRYEGSWAYDKPNGFGVLRGIYGEIRQQGFYRFGVLQSGV